MASALQISLDFAKDKAAGRPEKIISEESTSSSPELNKSSTAEVCCFL